MYNAGRGVPFFEWFSAGMILKKAHIPLPIRTYHIFTTRRKGTLQEHHNIFLQPLQSYHYTTFEE